MPGELTLAEEFGVSRTTMRDAISGLVEKGFLERQHGKGVLVIDNSRNVAVDSVRNMILRGNYTVAEFMETRQMIDNQIVRFAALRSTEKETDKMERHISDMIRNYGELEKYLKLALIHI